MASRTTVRLTFFSSAIKRSAGSLSPYKVDTLFDARLQLSGKLLIQTAWFNDFHIRSRKMATIFDLLYHFYTLSTTGRHEKAA